jgi:hypothetical protein
MSAESPDLVHTAYHELGHAITSAAMGYDSYIDVIRVNVDGKWKLGLTITPGINQYSPRREYLLRILGGGLGEFLREKGGSCSQNELLVWLRLPERRTGGTATDWKCVEEETKGDLDPWLLVAAEFATTQLYRAPLVEMFPAFADRLICWRSARVAGRDGKVEIQQEQSLDEAERTEFICDRYPSRFRGYVDEDTWEGFLRDRLANP